MDCIVANEKREAEGCGVKNTLLKPIKPLKHEIMEGKSCQQELMRIKKVQLPDHRPDCVDITNFLQRVPPLPRLDDKKKVLRCAEYDNGKGSQLEIEKLSSVVRKLQKPNTSSIPSIESNAKDDSITFEDGSPSHPDCKKLNSFFERLQRHTTVAKHQDRGKNCSFEKVQHSSNNPDCATGSLQSFIDFRKVIGSSETPGAGLQELKSQLHKQIKVMRDISHREAVYKNRLENECFDDEEEEFWPSGDRLDTDSKTECGEDYDKCDNEKCRESNKHASESHIEMKSIDIWNDDSDVKTSVASESSFPSSHSEGHSLALYPDDEAANDADSFNNDSQDDIQFANISADQSDDSGPGDDVENSCSSSQIDGSIQPDEEGRFGVEKAAQKPIEYEKLSSIFPELDDSSRAQPIIAEDLHLSLDDNSQFSQVLDTQGYFNPRKATFHKINTSSGPVCEFMSVNRNSSSTEIGKLRDKTPCHLLPQNIEERDESQDLLDLCSGSFNDPVREEPSSNPRSVVARLLDQCKTEETDSQIMLGLCSGKFGSPTKSQTVGTLGNIETETAMARDFSLPDTGSTTKTICEGKETTHDCSGACLHPSGYSPLQDSCEVKAEINLDSEDGGSNDKENEEDLFAKEYCDNLVPKKFSKAQFYEEEAELSGSDVGEDEDDDLDSELDEYESESEVEDLPSESKLKAQVHKAHMKATLADDKQDIRIIQERFYEDGDLLMGGLGRRRNFRWRNIDNTINVDNSSDESDQDDEGNAESNSLSVHKSVVERLEREAFCEEQSKLDQQPMLDENSQSILNIISDNGITTDEAASQHKQSISFKRQGSFLDRNKSTLTRLSSVTSNHSKLHNLPRSFVFQVNSRNNSSCATSSKKFHNEESHPKKVKLDPSLSKPPLASIFGSL